MAGYWSHSFLYVYDYQLSKARRSYHESPRLVSNGNNIATCNFARLAANDVKGRQVVFGNGASCPEKTTQLEHLNLVTKRSSRLTQLIVGVATIRMTSWKQK